MTDKNKTQISLIQRARNVIPGGVNSPVRAFNGVGGDPVFISSAKGPHLFDNDGNREEKHSSKNNVTSNIELLKRPARKSKTVKLPLLLILLVILIVMMYYLDNIMN